MPQTPSRAVQDAELGARITRHDPTAISDIFQAYGGTLRRVIRRNKGPAITDSDVEDLVGDSVTATALGWRPDRGSTVRSYLFAVARKRVASRLRAYGRRPELRLTGSSIRNGPVANVLTPVEELIEREGRAAKLDAIHQAAAEHLTTHERAVFYGRWPPDPSGRQAAVTAADSRSENARRKTLSVATAKIRRALGIEQQFPSSKGASRERAVNHA
ncbi:MAG: RNA polymerase sigma factor [Phycisphaerales bacterium]